jgi:(1->4)-alpha-D-glucan 1-alpha-D-glucosylmutase
VQLSRRFGFREAADPMPHLAALGIGHLCASPTAEARPGSTHGCDVIDHNRLNPKLRGRSVPHLRL